MKTESVWLQVLMHVCASVARDTPFAILLQTEDIDSVTPEVKTILEFFVNGIFNGVLVSVHVPHFSVNAPVGTYDVEPLAVPICTEVETSPATLGVKTAYLSIRVSTHVGDSSILISFNDVEIVCVAKFTSHVVIAPSTGWTQREDLDIFPFMEIFTSHIDTQIRADNVIEVFRSTKVDSSSFRCTLRDDLWKIWNVRHLVIVISAVEGPAEVNLSSLALAKLTQIAEVVMPIGMKGSNWA